MAIVIQQGTSGWVGASKSGGMGQFLATFHYKMSPTDMPLYIYGFCFKRCFIMKMPRQKGSQDGSEDGSRLVEQWAHVINSGKA